MCKNKLNETMENMYAMKLIDWELEGKREEVSYCQSFVCQLDMYMNLSWADKEKKEFRWMKIYKSFNNEISHEATRWCVGYASLCGFDTTIKVIMTNIYDNNFNYVDTISTNYIFFN